MLLRLASSAMKQRIKRGLSISDAIEYTKKAFEKRGVKAFDRRDARQRDEAVALTVGASLDLLSTEEKQKYSELAIFPEDTDIPISVVGSLWEFEILETEDLLLRLYDLSLLQKVDLEARTIRLHDVMRDYLLHELQNEEATHGKLLDSWTDVYQLPNEYAWRWFGYHLQKAEGQGPLRRLLLDMKWIEAKLRSSGPIGLLADYDMAGTDPEITKVRDAIRLSGHILAQDPSQLAAQLSGRLGLQMFSTLQQALVPPQSDKPQLLSLMPSLTTPDSPLVQTWMGRWANAKEISLSSNGQRALSYREYSPDLSVWDTVCGSTLRVIKGTYGECSSIAICADGSLGVSGHSNGKIAVWNLCSGDFLRSLDGHDGRVFGLSIRADGTQVISAAEDSTVRVWDIKSGILLHKLDGFGDRVVGIALSSEANRAIIASPRALEVWDITSGSLLHTLIGHGQSSAWGRELLSVSISANGRRAVSSGGDFTMRVWNTDSGRQELEKYSYGNHVDHLEISADGLVVLCSNVARLHVWNAGTGDELREPIYCGDFIDDVAISSDGTWGLSTHSKDAIKRWNLKSHFPERKDRAHAARINSIVICRDEPQCISTSADGVTKVHELGTFKEIGQHDVRLQGHSNDMAASANGQVVVTCGLNWVGNDYDSYGFIDVLELSGESESKVFRTSKNQALSVAVTPSGDTAFVASGERYIDVMDIHHGKRVNRLPHSNVHSVAMSSNGIHLASASYRVIKVWDWRNAQVVGVRKANILSREREGFGDISLNGNGRIVADGWQSAIEVWDINKQTLSTLSGHEDGVLGLALTDNGEMVVSTSWDKTVRLWDVAKKKQVAVFYADHEVYRCAILPDGSLIIAGDYSGALHILSTGVKLPSSI